MNEFFTQTSICEEMKEFSNFTILSDQVANGIKVSLKHFFEGRNSLTYETPFEIHPVIEL